MVVVGRREAAESPRRVGGSIAEYSASNATKHQRRIRPFFLPTSSDAIKAIFRASRRRSTMPVRGKSWVHRDRPRTQGDPRGLLSGACFQCLGASTTLDTGTECNRMPSKHPARSSSRATGTWPNSARCGSNAFFRGHDEKGSSNTLIFAARH